MSDGSLLAARVAFVALPAMLGGTSAYAQQAANVASQPTATALTNVVAAADPYISPIDTMWTLGAAFLVFGMQAGLTMLEAGFCRSHETVNVLVECVFDTCLCGLRYWAWGYAFMFGAGNGLIGWHDPSDTAESGLPAWWFLSGVGATTLYGATGVPVLAHWLFPFAFADCASTICSGTMIDWTAFWGGVLYSVAVGGFIYPILGHGCWGPDGFLYLLGTPASDGSWWFLDTLGMNFHDLAGSTVVHSIGGWSALADGIRLGPRLGRRFKRDGGGPMLPHDLTIAVVGGLILWFGWYGFNPGSTLSAMDVGGIGRVAANTTLAACSAGLVAITASCYWLDTLGPVLLGGIAGGLVIAAIELLEFLRIDDPIGAWPVHDACGIWRHALDRLLRQRQVRRRRLEQRRHARRRRQLRRRPPRPVLRRRREGSRSPVDRRPDHLRQHVRPGDGRLRPAEIGRSAPHQRRGRTRGHRHPRARHLRLPRIRHLVAVGPGRHARRLLRLSPTAQHRTNGGCGSQRGYTETYRGGTMPIRLLSKVKLEIAVNDEYVDFAVRAIMRAAKSETDRIGDGKVLVLPLDECVRIRTGESGNVAIGP